MSRSKRNRCGKGTGFEYGSRRVGNRIWPSPGKYGGRFVKTVTNRTERRIAARELNKDKDAE